MLLSVGRLFWFYFNTGTIEKITSGIKFFNSVPSRDFGLYDIAGTIKGVAKNEHDGYYYITTSGAGVRKMRVSGDTMYSYLISTRRYGRVSYDHAVNGMWMYGYNIVQFYTSRGSMIMTDGMFRRYGILNAERILSDRLFGNLLVKDYNNLYYIHPISGTIKTVLKGFPLREAHILLHKDKIIAAAMSGVVFCRILGPGRFSRPVFYPNTRSYWYGQVHDLAVLDSVVYLRTDKADYAIPVPDDMTFHRASESGRPYRLIASYAGKEIEVSDGQRLVIDQQVRRLQLDVINPLGAGKPHFSYRIAGVDAAWQQLAGKELFLPELSAGKTYSLSLVAADDHWKSSPVNLLLYIHPYWWQRPEGKVFVSVLVILGVLLFAMATVFATKHYVRAQHRKKQRLTELELRAVYAQINPHFIFNTLNSAIYFIKNKKSDDALAHVTKFSRLLRSYLESSRNRYITVAAEIENIRNYVELQQVRFDHIFSYELSVTGIPRPEYVKIPSLLLQPFIENAINHGLLPKEAPGLLRISFTAVAGGREIICIIEDDGVGRATSPVLPKDRDRKSYGNQLINELVDLFNEYEKMGITIEYKDKYAHNAGTAVIICIKNPVYEQSVHQHHS
jgi:hypothetical protein